MRKSREQANVHLVFANDMPEQLHDDDLAQAIKDGLPSAINRESFIDQYVNRRLQPLALRELHGDNRGQGQYKRIGFAAEIDASANEFNLMVPPSGIEPVLQTLRIEQDCRLGNRKGATIRIRDTKTSAAQDVKVAG
jgi:hypothetical protein